MTTTSPMYIEPPAPPVVQPGIFDVALGPMDFPVPAAVGNGVIYLPDDCTNAVFLAAMNCPPVTGTKTFSSMESPVSGAPFIVGASYQCSPVGMDLTEAEKRLRIRLALREQRAVEQRIWSGFTGVLGTLPSLFADATILGPASCITEAVELLEQWLADQAIVGGVIHARPGMVSHMAASFQLQAPSPDPRILRTHLGTPVVFGQGYGGTGPSGNAPTTDVEWLYATGRVLIWRAEAQVPPLRQTFDRANNNVLALIERPYAVAIECGVAAVQVTRNCLTAGSA